MASPTLWTWVWASFRSWWWTGRPGMLRSIGLQRVGHDWVTELNWTDSVEISGAQIRLPMCINTCVCTSQEHGPLCQDACRVQIPACYIVAMSKLICLLSSHVFPSMKLNVLINSSVSLVSQLCLTLWNPMDCSTPGFPIHHQLLELVQTHVHWVGDAITIPFSVILFFSYFQSLPASGSFPMSQFFASGGQSIGALAYTLAKARERPVNVSE